MTSTSASRSLDSHHDTACATVANSHIRGALPATICLVCLTLMWMESVLGLCLGCEIHAYLVRRGWTTKDEAYEVRAGGVCDIPAAHQSRSLATADIG